MRNTLIVSRTRQLRTSAPGCRVDHRITSARSGNWCSRLYRARAHLDAKYFVDKTPRYVVISPEIVELFPDARFVFLLRNPLAIISSIIETWGTGRWNIYEFEFELFDGLENLIAARRHVGPRACSVRFEELVGEGSGAREALFRQLGTRIRCRANWPVLSHTANRPHG